MVPHADVRELAAAMQRSGDVLILDVREPFEFASGHVPGAVHLPMHLVPLRLDDIPRDRTVYVICATGNRSWQVAHYLGQHGLTATNVKGGTSAWRAAGLTMETTPREVGAGRGAAR